MSAVCWLEDRDDRLARARALAVSDLEAALALVDSVLAEVVDDVEALRARADILTETGDVSGARRALERLVTVDATDARALIDLADLERDPAEALPLYERAIALLEDIMIWKHRRSGHRNQAIDREPPRPARRVTRLTTLFLGARAVPFIPPMLATRLTDHARPPDGSPLHRRAEARGASARSCTCVAAGRSPSIAAAAL